MTCSFTLLGLVGLLSYLFCPALSAPTDGLNDEYWRELEDILKGSEDKILLAERTAGPAVVGNCGLISGEASRILGGSEAPLKKLPWQVRLTIPDPKDPNYVGQCGGTIISDQWVVSAAHCVEQKDGTWMTDASKITLNFGEIDFTYFEYESEVQVQPDKLIVHPGRKVPPSAEVQAPNDLLMIKLKEKLTFNDYVNAACLPNSNEQFPDGTQCIVSGFGATGSPDGSPSPALKSVSLNLIADSTCKETIPYFTDDYLCAGRDKPQMVDACQGDSGGPLVCKSDGRYTLEGAVAFGGDCSRLEISMGVYSSIPFHLAWIKETMANN